MTRASHAKRKSAETARVLARCAQTRQRGDLLSGVCLRRAQIGANSIDNAGESVAREARQKLAFDACHEPGAGLVTRIKRDLLASLSRDGFSSIVDAIGADLRVP